MLVVADTPPLHYLILTEYADLLRTLLGVQICSSPKISSPRLRLSSSTIMPVVHTLARSHRPKPVQHSRGILEGKQSQGAVFHPWHADAPVDSAARAAFRPEDVDSDCREEVAEPGHAAPGSCRTNCGCLPAVRVDSTISVRQGPTHHLACIQIQKYRHLQPAFLGPQIGGYRRTTPHRAPAHQRCAHADSVPPRTHDDYPWSWDHDDGGRWGREAKKWLCTSSSPVAELRVVGILPLACWADHCGPYSGTPAWRCFQGCAPERLAIKYRLKYLYAYAEIPIRRLWRTSGRFCHRRGRSGRFGRHARPQCHRGV
jgi:hypothetical protein